MRELIEKGTPAEAHPSKWAPFVVVGRGQRAGARAADDIVNPAAPGAAGAIHGKEGARVQETGHA